MNARPRILLVDDEPNLRRVVIVGLRFHGFDVDPAEGGRDAMARLAARRPDAIILDINMPDIGGIALLPLIRRRCDAPVIMLTASSELDDKLDALGSGADDYLVKPFEMAELAARLKVHLRRRQLACGVLRYADLVVDTATRSARRGSIDMMLSPKEFDILVVLMHDQGTVFRKSQLLDRAWGPQAEIGLETVDRFISSLRQKLEYGGGSRIVQTVRGVGYALRGADNALRGAGNALRGAGP